MLKETGKNMTNFQTKLIIELALKIMETDPEHARAAIYDVISNAEKKKTPVVSELRPGAENPET